MKALRGFTLLETLVALAILGVSLAVVLNVNQQAVVSHLYAKRLTVATLLARGKMIDLEQKMHDEGLSVDDDEDSGDFSDEGWASYKWRAKIIAPKTNGLTPEQLFGAIFNLPMGDGKESGGIGELMGGMFGAGKSGAGGAGAPALPGGLPPGTDPKGGLLGMMGPMAGIASAQFSQMVQQIENSVREVHLTVSWKEGKLVESVDLVTHVVSLGKGSDRNSEGPPGGQAGGDPGRGGVWVRTDTGAVVQNAQPGPGGMVDPRDGMVLITGAQYDQRTGGRGALPGGGGILPGGQLR